MPTETVNNSPSGFVTSKEVTLPSLGVAKTLKKLKAGPYYEAQKIYVEWIQELQKSFAGSSIDFSKAVGVDGNLDSEKLKAMIEADKTSSVDSLLSKVNSASEKRLQLLSLCIGEKIEDMQANYYPEDIDLMVQEVVILNNFIGNLKNSVAPTLGIGAQQEKEKKVK